MARYQLASEGIGVAVDGSNRLQSGVSFVVSGGPLYADATGVALQATLVTGSTGLAPGWLDPDVNPGIYTISYAGGPAVAFAVGSASTALAGNMARKPTVAAGQLFVDPIIGSDLYDGLSWGTAKASLASAITALPAQGGRINLSAGTHTISTVSLATRSNVRITGQGTQATSIITTDTANKVFDFSGASFCTVEDLTLSCPTQRTAGSLFFLDNAGGSCQRNEFRRLRVHGGWRAWQLNDCTTVTIDEIQIADYNAAHGWHSMFNLSGAATSIIVANVRGGTAAAVTNGFLFINGAAVDTAHFRNWDVLNLSPSTGMTGVSITAGEWLKFTDFSMESGDQSAFVVNGGKGIDIISAHLLGLFGLNINTGTSVRMIGGEVIVCKRHGVIIGGGSHHELIGVTFSDLSQETNANYNGVNVAAAVSDFTIENCMFGNMYGSGNGNVMATAITVNVGASDRYVIRGNRVASTGVVTPMSDNGTGTDKVVSNNIWVGGGFPAVASAANLNLSNTFSSADVISVTGVTNVTSMTAGAKGRRVTLVFAGILTFTDGSNLKLAANFVTTADDTITLVSDGTNWIEEARSVN